MTFRTGDRVHQDTYGPGDIIDVTHGYITIAFDDGSTRKFATTRVRLQASDAPRPVRPKTVKRAKRKDEASMKRPPAGDTPL